MAMDRDCRFRVSSLRLAHITRPTPPLATHSNQVIAHAHTPQASHVTLRTLYTHTPPHPPEHLPPFATRRHLTYHMCPLPFFPFVDSSRVLLRERPLSLLSLPSRFFFDFSSFAASCSSCFIALRSSAEKAS